VEFRWNDWNLDHATRHGVAPLEAEAIVRRGPARHAGDNKYRVRGRGVGGRWLQVIYVIEQNRQIYVLHARPLTDREKRQLRRSES